mmetsp:Transcript_31350/g.86182  ORF Transcript_31350/g.86182 Transcript_31350/m.86182 type:complete len:945 (+) Transcript_31350:79-2913(+)
MSTNLFAEEDSQDVDLPQSSPSDILVIIFHNPWLAGAVLAVLASAMECLGLILQKKAQYRMMGSQIGPTDPMPGWSRLIRHPFFWLGLVIYMSNNLIGQLALRYVDLKTAVPLNSVLVVFNLLFSFGVLYERFNRRDIVCSLVCIVGIIIMSISLSQESTGEANYQKLIEQSAHILQNKLFASYILILLSMAVMCVYVITCVSLQNVAKPFALPLLCGILYALFSFVSRIALTMYEHGVWTAFTYKTIAFSGVTYVMALLAICEGVRQLSCRFFVPAFYVVCNITITSQNLLFFRQWEDMEGAALVTFVIGCCVSLLGVAYISSERRVIPSPAFTELGSPLLSPANDAVKLHRSVVSIIDEYKVRKPEDASAKPLETFPMDVNFSARWRFFPIFICLFLVGLPILLWLLRMPFTAFTLLTLFGFYQAWKMSAFIALFAYVGVKKIGHHENSNFYNLYKAEGKEKIQPKLGMKWEQVTHFVVLPNYKEDIDVLKVAIDSIAASGIAKTQIGVVLAMEERENREFKQGKTDMSATDKANKLINEYKSKFLHCVATYHPEGLEGDVPGKSANTKWAANQLFETIIANKGLDVNKVVLTIGDADSEFHSEYFAALTYYFIYAGGESDKTAGRYLTIWQPPILHLKNYISQPAVVRLCSFITSQHELANLADPNATRVPYSTYSISATLAQSVKGWDPEWISEDWHMYLKCFLATGGRVKVTPIFLPILNYTPEGETFLKTLMARWLQAKRHALGFSELVYMMEHWPRIFKSIDANWDRAVFVWRSTFLWVKLLMIHVFMAVFFVVSPMNGSLIAFFRYNEDMEQLNINSWTFLTNCVCQAICLVSFVSVFLISVLLYDEVKTRIDNSEEAAKRSIFWRSNTVHLVSVVVQSLLYLPIFFVFAGAAEWIAAAKTAHSTKFKYVTAAEGARSASVCTCWPKKSAEQSGAA